MPYQSYALRRAGKRGILPKARPDYLRMCDENMENPTDEEIREILKRAKNIAVVGLSEKPGFILAGVGQGGIAIGWRPISRGGAHCVMDRCIMQEHKRLLAEVGR